MDHQTKYVIGVCKNILRNTEDCKSKSKDQLVFDIEMIRAYLGEIIIDLSDTSEKTEGDTPITDNQIEK